MGKRIVYLVALAVLLALGYTYYKHRQTITQGESGEVHCVGCMSPEDAARFKKENAGEGADGQNERKNRTARQEATATQGVGVADTSTPATLPSEQTSGASAGTASSGNTPVVPPGTSNSGSLGAAPTADTVPPNPQNGLRFAGAGNYQWYRQGNLTWRVDTSTGRSCIVYATLEEWRKQIVASHGCGRES